MLIVEKFNKERHLPILKEWGKAWDYDYPWQFVPDHGWVAYNDDPVLMRYEPLGAMLVREAENSTAIIDLVITKPLTGLGSRSLVQEGLGKCFREAEHWAETHKIGFVLAMTLHPKLAEMAKSMAGFKVWRTYALWRVNG